MYQDLNKTITAFKKAQEVGFFCLDINTIDKAVAIISLVKICIKKQKTFQIISPTDLKEPIQNLFRKYNLEITQDVFSKDYIVSVDYSSASIEKVICKRDEESKKLNFVITPKDNVFNFDNVELISGGSSFDLMFVFGDKKEEEKYKEIFNGTEIISISKKDTDFGKYKFLINGKKSYSEVVYEIVKGFSDSCDEDVLNLLLQGIISKYKLLENGNSQGWEIVSKFLNYGADFNKAFRLLNYSKDYENLQLQKKVMENIRAEKEERIIWSKVSIMMDVDAKNLDTRGRIVFNICKDFDLAFVMYYFDKENVKVVMESNDAEKYSAVDFAKMFGGFGTKYRAVFGNKGMSVADFEQQLFKELKISL